MCLGFMGNVYVAPESDYDRCLVQGLKGTVVLMALLGLAYIFVDIFGGLMTILVAWIGHRTVFSQSEAVNLNSLLMLFFMCLFLSFSTGIALIAASSGVVKIKEDQPWQQPLFIYGSSAKLVVYVVSAVLSALLYNRIRVIFNGSNVANDHAPDPEHTPLLAPNGSASNGSNASNSQAASSRATTRPPAAAGNLGSNSLQSYHLGEQRNHLSYSERFPGKGRRLGGD